MVVWPWGLAGDEAGSEEAGDVGEGEADGRERRRNVTRKRVCAWVRKEEMRVAGQLQVWTGCGGWEEGW